MSVTPQLTRTQRQAAIVLGSKGRVRETNTWSSEGRGPDRFQRRTLQALVDAGLGEWDRAGDVVRAGAAESAAYAEEQHRQERAAARQARLDLLTGDPAAMAEAIVRLEERLARIPAHTHDIHGRVFDRAV